MSIQLFEFSIAGVVRVSGEDALPYLQSQLTKIAAAESALTKEVVAKAFSTEKESEKNSKKT